MKKILLAILAAIILAPTILNAQDPHLSQWRANPILTNAAMTGHIDDSQIRIAANYRSQWAILGSNISTTAVSFDMTRDNDRFSYGGYLLNNNLADIFTNTSLVASASYEITELENDKYHIKTGLQLGFIYKRFNRNNLTFDNQYDNGNFDPDLPSGENFNQETRLLPESSIGGYYYNTNKEHDFKPYGGFSIHHLTKPKENFSNGTITTVPTKWVAHGGGTYEFAEKPYTLSPHVLYMKQRTATELLIGMEMDYKFKNDIRTVLDLSYRNKDSFIIQTGVKIKDNWYRLGYDINVSPLRTFTKGKNALEFSVTFTPKGRFFRALH